MRDRSLVFLVTGASSGIGRSISVEAAAAGHRVFATARQPETIADLAPAISSLPLEPALEQKKRYESRKTRSEHTDTPLRPAEFASFYDRID